MRFAIDEDWYWLRRIYGSLEDPVLDVWSLLVIPSAVGVASVGIALAAVFASREATHIAQRSEAARVLAENRRDALEESRLKAEVDRQYQDRLDDSLVVMFRAIGDQLDELSQWDRATSDAISYGSLNSLTDPPVLEHFPPLNQVRACLDAVRLIARDDDRSVALSVERALGRIQALEQPKAVASVKRLIVSIRRWRDGTKQPDAVVEQLDKIGQTLNE
ncbi:hypothetical protein [Rathayibacter sp. PhB151]|uniref:hypothetical protein n=1 Tax=Rathayibacter sp. PhB151 TaxID=2485189 RepID=UPI0010637300|nr:hypothetical protein [Rathayibacter sp. PhB151]